jgi:hypothetical protein
MRPAYPARLRGQLLVVGGVGEVGVPAVEVVGEVVVEDSGADLEQQVGSAGCPAHLLFFDQMRLLMTWLTADSTNAVEMVSPARWRSP